MSNDELDSTGSFEQRQEQRFKVGKGSLPACGTEANGGKTRRGTVVDLSCSGIRLLCAGTFGIGQTISTELTTDRSHGVYKGVIRRVEPWVDGQSLLGCKLDDQIPESVLEGLSSEGAVNRRSEDRINMNHKATVRWPLQQGEVDVEVQDYSTGGMRISSSLPIPDDVRMLVRIDLADNDQLVIDVKTVWQHDSDDGCVAGVTYTHQETHDAVARALKPAGKSSELFATIEPESIIPSVLTVLFTASATAIGVLVYMFSKI
jgi:hypothetical protein